MAARESLFGSFENQTKRSGEHPWDEYGDKVLFLPDTRRPCVRMAHHEMRNVHTGESKGRGVLQIDIEDDDAPESIRRRRFMIASPDLASVRPEPRDTIYELDLKVRDGVRLFEPGRGDECEPEQARDLYRYLSDRAGLSLPKLFKPESKHPSWLRRFSNRS